MNFLEAVDFIIDLEGGATVVNNPDDPGGLTKFGISKRSYPNLDIVNLTIDQAREIYKKDFWDKVSGDLLPSGLNLLVFDAAINQGEDTASMALQRIVRAKADGNIGTVTLEALQGRSIRELILLYSLERHRLYTKAKWDKFGAGWSKRLLIVSLKAGEAANGPRVNSLT